MNVLIVNNVDLFNINVIIILLFILSITIHIIRVKKLSVKLIHIIWNSSCFLSDTLLRLGCSALYPFTCSLFSLKTTRSSSFLRPSLFLFGVAKLPAQLNTLSDFAEEQGMVRTILATFERIGRT